MHRLISPSTVRLMNAIGSLASRIGLPEVSLDPEALKARARRKSGQDGELESEGLRTLCRSLAEDVQVTSVGRIALRDQITLALVNKLRLDKKFHDSPSLIGTPLVPPIIITGLPRSGTTFLHRLLTVDPQARVVPTWEMGEPIPGPGRDRRRKLSISKIQYLRQLNPGIDAVHRFDADEPEEDTLLFDASMFSLTYWRLAPVYEYLCWFMRTDPACAYTHYRQMLLVLQASAPDRRLILKNPDHIGMLTALKNAVPEALIVQTHRDPAVVLPSYNSLMTMMHRNVATSLDRQRSGAASLDLWGWSVDRNLAMRSSGDRVVDVQYDELISDPISTAQRIYQQFDMKISSDHYRQLCEKVAKMPKNRYGKHDYNLADYGLSKAVIDDRFQEYRKRFLS